MELITGRTGIQHVKAIDDAEMYKAAFGKDDYVLDTGAKFNAIMSGTNAVIIQNGTALMQGRQCKIRQSDGQETLEIDSGTVGYKRWDVVCIEYNEAEGIESAHLMVVKGPVSSDWQEPTIEYEDGDIDSGETHRMKLWGVRLNGINFNSLIDYRKMVNKHNVSITVPSSPSRFDEANIKAYKSGSIVMLTGSLLTLTRTTIQTDLWFKIGRLPTGFRPVDYVYGTGIAENDSNNLNSPRIRYYIEPTSGDIYLQVAEVRSGVRDIDHISFTATFIAE